MPSQIPFTMGLSINSGTSAREMDSRHFYLVSPDGVAYQCIRVISNTPFGPAGSVRETVEFPANSNLVRWNMVFQIPKEADVMVFRLAYSVDGKGLKLPASRPGGGRGASSTSRGAGPRP